MGNKTKVLIVDDEMDFCVFVKRNLESGDEFEVAACSDSGQALETARSFRPDIALLDIMMPGLGGPDIAQELTREGIPVVFLTAVVTKEEVGKSFLGDIGGQRFIAKPVSSDELAASIRSVLKVTALRKKLESVE
ncbi:MAG: response regulator transcription factor [Deltaproteobacteria bacterium]